MPIYIDQSILGDLKAIITLVNENSESLEAMMALLTAYIKDYENDYSW